MPSLDSQTFGTIEYDDESVFSFPRGLPGFEDQRRFLPIERPNYQPLLFLQSLDRPELCFLTLPVLVVDPAYRLMVDPDQRSELGLDADRAPEIGRDVLCLTILTLNPAEPATANLMAPLVVNLQTRVAAQVLQFDSGYAYRHPIPTEAIGEKQACS